MIVVLNSEQLSYCSEYDSKYRIVKNSCFRFCGKCFTNQVRVAHTSKDEIDWKNCELNIDQLRDKKLKEIGI